MNQSFVPKCGHDLEMRPLGLCNEGRTQQVAEGLNFPSRRGERCASADFLVRLKGGKSPEDARFHTK